MIGSEGSLVRLIPQAEHKDLPSLVGLIMQRDCVENLVRNLFNMAFLLPDGNIREGIRPEVTSGPLFRFYSEISPSERISDDDTIARRWLDYTLGLDGEPFRVVYDPIQGEREVLTGMDNIIGLMEGMLNRPFDSVSAAQETFDVSSDVLLRSQRLQRICDIITTDQIRWAFRGPTISAVRQSDDISVRRKSITLVPLNYQDVTIVATVHSHEGQKIKKTVEKIKLLITTDHVCIRHRDMFSH